MRWNTVQIALIGIFVAQGFSPAIAQTRRATRPRAHKPVQKQKQPEPPPLPCGDYLPFQVLLDPQGFDPDAKPAAPAADAGDVAIQVSREESALRVTRADGSPLFFAPVTTGSQHDPLPPGNWTVVGVQWHPPFHYNPNLFWDAKPQDTKATIKPGPNNPVGVVWISLNLEHYGIHGTPEPGHVGHTESHGCVRLTNWDAARVASLVKRGTPVVFK